MNTRFLSIIFTLLFASLPTGCAYHDLRHDFDSYQPPQLFAVSRQASITPAVDTLEEKEPRVDQTSIDAQKKQWEDMLDAPPPSTSFFLPDQNRLDRFQADPAGDAQIMAALTPSFSLPDLEHIVLLGNPAIKAAEKRFRADLQSFSQIAGLDAILKQYSAFTEGTMPGIGPMKGRAAVDFPFPGVTALKGQIAEKKVQTTWESYQITIRDRITKARELFWNLHFNYQGQQVTKETANLLKRLESVAKTRYESGRTSFQDVIRIRIQKETVEENLLSLQEEQKNLATEIRELGGLNLEVPLGIPATTAALSVIPDTDALTALALQRRQEIRRLQAQIGKMERMLELSETMILPPYTFNLSRFDDKAINQVGSAAMRPAFPETTMAGRESGLPKSPWFGSNDAFLNQTRQKLQGMRQDFTDLQNKTRSLVRRKWFELDRSRRELTLYEESIVGLSQAALEVVTRGYESGEVAFADVIASHTTWLQANLASARRRSDLGIAHARLEEAVGAAWGSLENTLE